MQEQQVELKTGKVEHYQKCNLYFLKIFKLYIYTSFEVSRDSS